MKEVFEKIKERLEKKINPLHNVNWNAAIEEAIEIVNQVEVEYKDGHFGCNSNGQHEKCSDCCFRVECKHYGEWWFGNNVSEKPKGEQ